MKRSLSKRQATAKRTSSYRKQIRMFPKEYFTTGEFLSLNNVYIIALESNHESAESYSISVKITDGAIFLVGKIKNEDISEILGKLGITEQKFAERLRGAVRERTPILHENKEILKLLLVNGTKTSQVTIKLEEVNEDEGKSSEIKSLIFRMARHIKTVEDLMINANNLQESGSGFGQHILGAHASGKNIAKVKRSNPGMSIVNPTSKRSKSKPGVLFKKESSDESD